jgi:hypothetical protein
MLKPWNSSEWIKNLLASYETNRGKSAVQCKEEYLSIVGKLPFYGSALFFVEVITFYYIHIIIYKN